MSLRWDPTELRSWDACSLSQSRIYWTLGMGRRPCRVYHPERQRPVPPPAAGQRLECVHPNNLLLNHISILLDLKILNSVQWNMVRWWSRSQSRCTPSTRPSSRPGQRRSSSVRRVSTILALPSCLNTSGAGPIGCFVVKALQARGASKVIVSEPSALRRATAERAGAHHVFNPIKTDRKSVV